MTLCKYNGFSERVYPEILTGEGSLHVFPGEDPRELAVVPDDGWWLTVEEIPEDAKTLNITADKVKEA